ncbi:MAG: hypothetical protein K2G61_04650 [Bacteroidaceae bacterium]|nr:hypothetical protein [Bacteroidaceae bacterium]
MEKTYIKPQTDIIGVNTNSALMQISYDHSKDYDASDALSREESWENEPESAWGQGW